MDNPTLAETVEVLRVMQADSAHAAVMAGGGTRAAVFVRETAALARAVEVLERVQDVDSALYRQPEPMDPVRFNAWSDGVRHALAWARGEQ